MEINEFKRYLESKTEVEIYCKPNLIYKGQIKDFHFVNDFGYEMIYIIQKLRFDDDGIYPVMIIHVRKVD